MTTISRAYGDGTKGAYLNSIKFIQYLDGNVALQEIRDGNLDAYYFRIPLMQASSIYNDPHLKVYEKIGGSFGVLLNPAPSNDTTILNPFQFREVRYSMNYLIDRDFVVGEILKGHGTAQVDPFGVSSPEYESILPVVESFGFQYNPNLASKMIHDVLYSNGASKTDGKWVYNGSPISIKILIRSDDDSRKSMGEMISAQLEQLGFTVQREYGDLNKANDVVYGTNPQELRWQIYTEAFGGTSAFVRYNPVVPSQMYAPYFGKMPGWQNPSFWNYRNKSLDELTQSVEFSNFTSASDRDRLLQLAVKEGMEESVRLFVAQTTDPYVASSSISGLINDFGAGIPSRISLINARTDRGDNMNVGVKEIYQGAWNGVAGCTDVYCTNILSLVSDPPTFRNPYTGEVIPLRTVWTNITTLGPTSRLNVDPNAIIWNVSAQKWTTIGQNVSAKSAVTYEILYSDWHNGQPMNIADLLYSMYFPVEWGTMTGINDTTYDPEFTSQAQVALPLLKGIKFLDNRHIVSYVDFWHFDKKEIAEFASVWASSPWEISAATEQLVAHGKFAYSRSQASVKNVDWLSLIVPSHAEAILQELRKMKEDGYIPAPLVGVITKQDAVKRYDASIEWISRHKNAIVGNGPFVLDNFNPGGRVITLNSFKDPTYPFEKGYWAKYAVPRIASVGNFTPATVPIIISMGQPVSFGTRILVNGTPSNNVSIVYFISDRDGKVLFQGMAEKSDEVGEYVVNLTGNQTKHFSRGPNELKIFVNSNEALKPDIYSTTIIAIPRPE
ncbi:MAG: ABC transporter substrate-binding protein [Thermoproteota archaeon]|nr:ABC transporter substrate-binding protein [Thermoproteota archaeon]